jgi:hypothetical protein
MKRARTLAGFFGARFHWTSPMFIVGGRAWFTRTAANDARCRLGMPPLLWGRA